MSFCPKCEEEYRDGFERCMDCDIALVDRLKGPEDLVEVEETFAEELFEDDRDHLSVCGQCLNEFQDGVKSCRPCNGVPVMKIPAAELEDLLDRCQVKARANPRKLDPYPEDLVCLIKLKTPADAGFAVDSMLGMGVDAYIGRDGLDDFDDDSMVGVYVTSADLESAQMLVPADPAEWSDEVGDLNADFRKLLALAQSYYDIQKYAHAISLCSEVLNANPDGPQAFMLLGQLMREMGHRGQAREAFMESVNAQGPAGVASPAAFEFAVLSFLQDDGSVRFVGTEADEGAKVLKEHAALHPRDMLTQLLYRQMATARNEVARLGEVEALIRKVNYNLADRLKL